ncbi:MAG: DNA polymerase I [Chitinophagaceae bacterium]|nr:DNA polymerase I [Oligoflexus sp.]
MSKKRLFIIDCMAMAFRNFHAIRPLSTSQGTPVNAVYGCLMFLASLIDKEKPDYFVFATDSQEKTFRHEFYEAYKANRSDMPEDLAIQIPLLYRLFQAFQAPLLKESGLEADDLIGSLVHQFASPDVHCYIVSGDKDFMQLVCDNVSLYQPKKGGEVVLIEKEGVFEKFGCAPNQIIDILALIGDSSDNVPGVRGIGDKGAAKLIQEFHSLDGIYANLDKISNVRMRKGLEENKEMAYLSQRLVTIKTDALVPWTLQDFECIPETAAANPDLLVFTEEMEFRSYVEKIKGKMRALFAAKTKAEDMALHVPEAQIEGPGKPPREVNDYRLVTTEEDFQKLLADIQQTEVFAFDTETTGLDRIASVPIGLSLSFQSGTACYVPIIEKHRVLPEDRVKFYMQEILGNPNQLKVAHNAKFDIQMLSNIGITVAGPFADTLIASHLNDTSDRGHGLDDCCLRHFNYKKIPTKNLLDKQGTMLSASLDDLVEYACEDADFTFRLWELFQVKLAEKDLLRVFYDIEMPLVPVIARMESTGVHIDVDILQEISEKLAVKAKILEAEIFEIAGEEFNINSTKQLATIIFEKLKLHELLGLKRIKKTKTGYSTDVSVLEQMEEHPLGKALLSYRTIMKLKSTYVDSLPQLINPKSNRLHTNFHQAGTTTGRLSSNDPNLQNIPIRSEEGREIRKAFKASQKDWVIISADYSQIELRILAFLAQETNLRQAFVDRQDIHTATASRIFGVPAAEVTGNQRAQAKAINFGIIYGMGPQRLARETGVGMKEAKDFIDRYFATYPGIRDYIDRSIAFAREHEYTMTISGRRRTLREINETKDRMLMANAQNIAVNAPVQGSAADLIKIAMVRVQKKLDETGSRARMLLQVHDELVFECPRDEMDQVIALVRQEMEGAYDFGVPLQTDVGVGDNWLEAH